MPKTTRKPLIDLSQLSRKPPSLESINKHRSAIGGRGVDGLNYSSDQCEAAKDFWAALHAALVELDYFIERAPAPVGFISFSSEIEAFKLRAVTEVKKFTDLEILAKVAEQKEFPF